MMLSSAVLFVVVFGVVLGQQTTPKPTTPVTTPLPTLPPSSSTAKPTVKPTSPIPTTVVPNVTTTVSPPTTPAPTGPPRNTYNVSSTNGTYCILMEAALQVKISYLSHNKTKEAVIPLDTAASVDNTLSTCHGPNDTQVLAITFAEHNSLVFTFKKNSTVFVSSISVTFTEDPKHFPESDQPGLQETVHSGKLQLYSVLPGRSYLCNRDGPVTISSGVTLDVLSVQLQAYTNETSHGGLFGTATECSSSDISNIIPIAVGVALAALVLVVLIAYVIGRRRSRQKGYQSV